MPARCASRRFGGHHQHDAHGGQGVDELAEYQETCECRGGGFERDEDREHLLRQVAQGPDLQGVGNRRRQQRHGESREREVGREELRAGRRRSERQDDDGCDGRGAGESRRPAQGRGDAGAGHDVPRPSRGGDQGEGDAHRVETAGRAGLVTRSEQDHPGQGEQYPQGVARTARQHRGQSERTEEFDGDGGGERQSRQCRVERRVHQRQTGGERRHGLPLLACPRAHPRPDEGAQDRRREHETQGDSAERARPVEQCRGERRPELHGQYRSQDGRHRHGGMRAVDVGHHVSLSDTDGHRPP